MPPENNWESFAQKIIVDSLETIQAELKEIHESQTVSNLEFQKLLLNFNNLNKKLEDLKLADKLTEFQQFKTKIEDEDVVSRLGKVEKTINHWTWYATGFGGAITIFWIILKHLGVI
jgi:hypothetical protein